MTEDTAWARRKGENTKLQLETVLAIGEQRAPKATAIQRIQYHRNKHEELLAIAKRHPALRPLVPVKRALWHNEPKSYVIFEAVALAEAALWGLEETAPNTPAD